MSCLKHNLTVHSRREQLVFLHRPATIDATWHSGTMDIVAFYWGHPFAFMSVHNGHFVAHLVNKDAQWTLRCPLSNNQCYESRLLITMMEGDLRDMLHDRIVEGCTQVIRDQCPDILETKRAKIEQEPAGDEDAGD